MSSQEAVYVSPMEVTPTFGQRDSGHLAVSSAARWSDSEPALRRSHEVERGYGQTTEVGVYADQRFYLADVGKAYGRKAKVSNRTWENRPSGIIGGPRET